MRRSYPPKSLWAQSYGVFVWSQSCNLSGPGPQFSWTKWIAKRRQVAGETDWEDPSFVCFSVIHRLESLGLGWRPELSVKDWRGWRPPKCVGISWQHPLCPADDHSWNKAWNRKVQKFGARNSTKPSYQLGQAICQNCSDRSIIAMCQNKNSWIIASAQLASTVVQSMFCTYRSKLCSTAIWDYTWWSVAKMALAMSSWWGDQQTKKAATTTNTSLTAWPCGFIITLQIGGKEIKEKQISAQILLVLY